MNGRVVTSKPVYVPEAVWGRLASAAEDRGVTVEDLLVTAIEQVIIPGSVDERIRRMARAGFPDAAIAEQTGQLLARVARVRRAAHIPATRFYRGEGRTYERKTA